MSESQNLVLLLSDMKGFTARTSSQTREENARMLALHDALLLPVVRGFGGRKRKGIGDALLASFESPTDAALCAMALQDRLAAFNLGAPPQDRIEVRVALSQGEVSVQRRDLQGEALQLALEACAFAQPGEVVLTDAVYLSMNKSEAPSSLAGELPLRGGGKMRLRRALRSDAAGALPSGSDGALPSGSEGALSASSDGALPYGGRALRRLGRLPDPRRALRLRAASERLGDFTRRRATWAAAALLLLGAAAGERGSLPSDPLTRAEQLLETRQPLAALAELDRLADTPRASDPSVAVVRGKAEHELGQLGLAFSDFAAAAARNPRALDAKALSALADQLDSEAFPALWRPALVRLLGETVGAPAAPELRRVLGSARVHSRDDALEALELSGAATADDRLLVAEADLSDPHAPCAARRSAVQRLRLVSSPRSAALLEKAAWGSGCGAAQARDALRQLKR